MKVHASDACTARFPPRPPVDATALASIAQWARRASTPAIRLGLALAVVASTAWAQQPREPLAATALPLRLAGVARHVAAPAMSAGLIECLEPPARRGAWLYAVGERACDVALIVEVVDDAVVVRNLQTGRLELLALPQDAASAPAPPPGDGPTEDSSDAPPAPLVERRSTDVVTIELSRELLRRYTSNLPDVLGAALATPHYTSGESGPRAIDGFAMTRIKAGGIVEQLGLQDGDVLMDLDGQRLDNLAAVAGMLARADALSGATMTVLRGGTRLSFVFTVK
ncbi:MAG: hypothetical protein JNM38_16485 [Acidobacteria bacterium]|nr:hypothetical protein [Acidobacteriota bacterium]